MESVNLDYASSTPMRASAVAAQLAYDASPIAGANPNALHSLGRRAARELDRARASIARSLGKRVRPSSIVFTGGGTEANQLAVVGVAEGARDRDPARTRVVLSSIEHDSVLDLAPVLRAAGFQVTLVDPDRTGVVEPGALASVLSGDVALVSVMLANNETGVVQPVPELARVAHAAGALYHADAIQGYLHIPIDVASLGVDALTVCGHKVGAPVSIGAAYLAPRCPVRAQTFGGGQEAGIRAGTQDVRSAAAFAAVADELAGRVEDEARRVRALADGVYGRLMATERIHPTMGDPASVERLPGIVSVLVDGAESQDLVLALDARGFEVSAGSACSSASAAPSHVLTAMGISADVAAGSIRVSFDDRVDPADLERFCDAFVDLVEDML